jgi:hypothetical protein
VVARGGLVGARGGLVGARGGLDVFYTRYLSSVRK